MRSRCTAKFWSLFATLPPPIQRKARTRYRQWRLDAAHPSLRFKKVHATQPIWSLRIDRDYRALGVQDGSAMLWFWIGSHADYDRLTDQS